MLTACLVAGAAVLVHLMLEDHEPAPASRSSTDAPAPAAAAATVRRLADALRAGDRSAAEALAVPGDTATADRLGAAADAVENVGIDDVRLRYTGERGEPLDDDDWLGVVDVTWSYAGFDDEPATVEVPIGFRIVDDAVRVSSIGADELAGRERLPIWLAGPVRTARTADVLVVASASRRPQSYLRTAVRALPEVSRIVRGWRPSLVVEVPADADAVDRTLGAEPGSHEPIAATAAPSTPGMVQDAPVHVVVNPDVFDPLGPAARQVVMTHEATHVATDSPASAAPTWLVEGFADYVALRGAGRTETGPLPLTRTAVQIADRVRADGLPARLPDEDDLDAEAPHLGAAYEAAWLACVTLAERRGPDALARLVHRVGAGVPLADGLRTGFGWTEGDLVRAWRARLAELGS